MRNECVDDRKEDMDRRVLKTQEAIRVAYFELLGQSLDGKVTITEIAKKANIDRKTFYLHFESVEAMVKKFGEEKIAELHNYLNERKFFENPYDKNMIYNAIGAIIEKDEYFYRRLVENECNSFFWTGLENELVKIITKVYLKEMLFDEEELRLLGKFFTAGTINIYRSWLKGEIKCSLQVLNIVASEVSFRGIQGIIAYGKDRKQKELEKENGKDG